MPTTVRTPAASLRVFLQEIVDYAGLFPPAALNMRQSVDRYACDRRSPDRWMLGRFVLPVARLDEFLNAQENATTEPWRLAGIITGGATNDATNDAQRELEQVEEFNRKAPGAVMDTVELRAADAAAIEQAWRHKPSGTRMFFEIAPEQAAELLPVLQGLGAAAKLRTGGVVQEAFPAVMHVARFLACCAESRVPFKATAGLHHPLRSMRPLTYEPNAREGMMHGFLNLFTAAAMAWSETRHNRKVPVDKLAACLADGEFSNWHFGDDALVWSGSGEPVRLELEALRMVREEFALSFGSCSLEEPQHDLRALGLL